MDLFSSHPHQHGEMWSIRDLQMAMSTVMKHNEMANKECRLEERENR